MREGKTSRPPFAALTNGNRSPGRIVRRALSKESPTNSGNVQISGLWDIPGENMPKFPNIAWLLAVGAMLAGGVVPAGAPAIAASAITSHATQNSDPLVTVPAPQGDRTAAAMRAYLRD